ncbi:MAG: hypothetical protein FJ112_02335 [Deltaproteobacteria bacterium]|nr:hypothetical protein [Deltaproteobacteria bacterium]
MNEKLKSSLFILLLGVLWGGYELYDFFNGEQVRFQAQLEQKNKELLNAKNELERLKNFSTRLEEVKARVKKTNNEFEEALEYIPRTLDFSKLLAKLNLLARNSGVEIEVFKPLKDQGNSSAEGNSTEEKTNSFYQTVTLDLKLNGGFAQTLMFFDQISRLKRILNVESLNMTPKTIDGQRGLAVNLTPIETNVVLKTYRFSE